MEHDAWRRSAFRYPSDVPTMISDEERRYLYWLANSVWTGKGVVLEIGPWLGGSTVCLAAGMADSVHDAHAQLYALDNFIWREFMALKVPLDLAAGDSFMPFFLKNVRDFREVIVPLKRSLPDEQLGSDSMLGKTRFTEEGEVPRFDRFDQPIEILFVDGAKSWLGISHLLRIVNENLIPGRSLLICQDYKFWGAYWVALMMQRLRDYLEPVHNVLDGGTVAFRLTEQIPSEVVSGFESHVEALSTGDSLESIDAAAEILAADGDRLGATSVRLAKVRFLVHQKRTGQAIESFQRAQRDWRFLDGTYVMDDVTKFLQRESGREIQRRGLLNFASGIRRQIKAIRAAGKN